MGTQPYMEMYYYPIRSRNKRLWLCYVKEEKSWALSSSPYFQNSADLGFRWENRVHAICILNMVSKHPFGSDDQFAAVKRWNAHFRKFAFKSTDKERRETAIEMLFG